MRTAGKYSYAACVWRQHTAHLVYAAEKKAFGKRAAAVSQHPISGRGHLAGLDGCYVLIERPFLRSKRHFQANFKASDQAAAASA